MEEYKNTFDSIFFHNPYQLVLKKYNRFPSMFVVLNLFKFSLKNWSNNGMTLYRAFAISSYLSELFGTDQSMDELIASRFSKRSSLDFFEIFEYLQE